MLQVKFSNKTAYTLVAILVLLSASLIAYALGGNNPSQMGHSAGEVLVNIDGQEKTLQQAINDNDFGGGYHPMTPTRIWEDKGNENEQSKGLKNLVPSGTEWVKILVKARTFDNCGRCTAYSNLYYKGKDRNWHKSAAFQIGYGEWTAGKATHNAQAQLINDRELHYKHDQAYGRTTAWLIGYWK